MFSSIHMAQSATLSRPEGIGIFPGDILRERFLITPFLEMTKQKGRNGSRKVEMAKIRELKWQRQED